MALIDLASRHQMRTLAWVAAVLTSFAMMIPLAALWSSPTGAAPNCLAQPNFKAADGRHWYYRTDQATKRKCWYVKPRNESLGQAPAKEPPAARPVPSKPPKPPEESVQAVWGRLFPSNPLYEPPSRYVDARAERPIDTDNPIDQPEPPPIAAAFIADEPPMAPAVEGRNHFALIVVALLLIALAAGAGVKHWRAGKVSGGRRADYLAVLSRAVANGDPNDREARRDIYTCARRVLVDQLHAADPPVGEAVIKAEQAALDAAIAQLDSQSPYGHKRELSPLRALTDRAFTPRFGSGGTRPSARRRLGEIATWALRASRPA